MHAACVIPLPCCICMLSRSVALHPPLLLRACSSNAECNRWFYLISKPFETHPQTLRLLHTSWSCTCTLYQIALHERTHKYAYTFPPGLAQSRPPPACTPSAHSRSHRNTLFDSAQTTPRTHTMWTNVLYYNASFITC